MEPQPAEASGTAQLPALPARGRRPLHPPTLHMVIEALQDQDQGKGASVIAIKRFILAKYPTVDPIRLKYLLKQALAKGLSRGDLVRPPNSAAMGATGRFKLAPEKLRQKQPPPQADPDGGQAPKQGRKEAAKPARAPAARAKQRGAVEQEPAAAKAKPVEDPPPAAAKPLPAARSAAAKPLPAAGQPKAPGKRRLGDRVAPAAEDAGEGDGSSAVGAGAKGKAPTRKAPVGNSKGKAPKGTQPDPPKAKAGQGKARKPRVIPAAAQGEAGLQKAAPATRRKAP